VADGGRARLRQSCPSAHRIDLAPPFDCSYLHPIDSGCVERVAPRLCAPGSHNDICFARRPCLAIAIGDSVVRAIDRVDRKSQGLQRAASLAARGERASQAPAFDSAHANDRRAVRSAAYQASGFEIRFLDGPSTRRREQRPHPALRDARRQWIFRGSQFQAVRRQASRRRIFIKRPNDSREGVAAKLAHSLEHHAKSSRRPRRPARRAEPLPLRTQPTGARDRPPRTAGDHRPPGNAEQPNAPWLHRDGLDQLRYRRSLQAKQAEMEAGESHGNKDSGVHHRPDQDGQDQLGFLCL
jgi:hypothetical protein